MTHNQNGRNVLSNWKAVLAIIASFIAIIGSLWAAASHFESKDEHRIDMLSHKEKEVLERRLLASEIVQQIKEWDHKTHHRHGG